MKGLRVRRGKGGEGMAKEMGGEGKGSEGIEELGEEREGKGWLKRW